jgi:hypothetical protein
MFTAGHAQAAQDSLQQQGTQRFFKPDEGIDWKTQFKDLEWEVEVDVTNENLDEKAMDTLTTTLQVVANPNFANNPAAQLIVGKILRLTGAVSTVELAALPQPPPPQASKELQQQAMKNKVSESINFKDLPPDGQVQMAKQAGITISPPTPQAPVASPIKPQPADAGLPVN